MSIFDEDALKLHREHRGKLAVASKVPLANKEDLSLAYTPGVAAVSRALAEDAGLMYELTPKGNTVAVVSGSAFRTRMPRPAPDGGAALCLNNC